MCASFQSVLNGRVWLLLLSSLHVAVAGKIQKTPLTYAIEGKAGFTRLSGERTGITVTNLPEDSILNGSGVAAGDFDGDDLCDLYFCRLEGGNVLYRNLGGWKFEDVTATAGVACPEIASTGAVFADVEADGDLDLLVNSFENGSRLFINDGKGRFKDETAARGLSMKGSASSMGLADTDADGDLDLYVAYIRAHRLAQGEAQFKFGIVDGQRAVVAVNGRPVTDPDLTNRFTVTSSGRVEEYGQPDIFYKNNGQGFFEPVAWTSGVFLQENGKVLPKPPHDWGLAVQFYDINNDRAPDIYVCNDYFTPDRIWVNQRNGTFKELPELALRTTSYAAMSVDFGDFNRDGHPDCYVVEMISRSHLRRQIQVIDVLPYYFQPGEEQSREQIQQNTLLLNRGDTTFAEIARFSGVEASEWSWCTILMDVDMDGWEDILISNGHGRDLQNADSAERVRKEALSRGVSPQERMKLMMRSFEPLKVPKVAYRNNHDLTFTESGERWGFNTPEVSHGMALADLDNDGDMDLVMNNLGSAAGIYRNDSPAPRVGVRLIGGGKNRAAVGSKIIVKSGLGIQRQEIICGGRYLSGDQMQRTFAVSGERIEVDVHWPDGRVTKIENATADSLYEITATDAAPALQTKRTDPTSLFQDVSHQLGHTHLDQPFDDWEAQPALPTTLSHLGPGISWHDYDNDGYPDLILPAGKGGAMEVYRNDTGRFKLLANDALGKASLRDQTTVIGVGPILIAGTSNYEDGSRNGGWARAFNLRSGTGGEMLPQPTGCTGPLAMADVNGDGALDLFIGVRAVSGKYPDEMPSTLYLQKNNTFEPFQQIDAGLVSGAAFSDIDGDGDPDLILACVWGPVRVFANENGRYVDATARFGLDQLKGLWNGVATADFNSDGRPDIIASNWGKNSRWRATLEYPLKLYYGDFDRDGTIEMADALFDPTLGREVPLASLRFMARAIPELNARMPTFASYAEAPLNKILNVKDLPTPLEVTTLATTIFLNGGARFTPRELPAEAQFTPAFGIAAADFNGDGHDDVFLSQNFFGTNLEMPRPDPGRGLLLLGNGAGDVRAASGEESGLFVNGEQRGCALADFDRDGKLDLAIARNSAATKLFRNQGGARCLAVTLVGAPPNVAAVGAALRYTMGGRTRICEIQAGTGYWSVNSPTQLLGPRHQITSIEVRFPGKHWQTVKIPAQAWEVTVDAAGALKVLK